MFRGYTAYRRDRAPLLEAEDSVRKVRGDLG